MEEELVEERIYEEWMFFVDFFDILLFMFFDLEFIIEFLKLFFMYGFKKIGWVVCGVYVVMEYMYIEWCYILCVDFFYVFYVVNEFFFIDIIEVIILILLVLCFCIVLMLEVN